MLLKGYVSSVTGLLELRSEKLVTSSSLSKAEVHEPQQTWLHRVHECFRLQTLDGALQNDIAKVQQELEEEKQRNRNL